MQLEKQQNKMQEEVSDRTNQYKEEKARADKLLESESFLRFLGNKLSYKEFSSEILLTSVK